MRAAASAKSQVRPVVAVAAACGAGARDQGCADGPAAIRRYWDRYRYSELTGLVWEQMPEGICAGASPLQAVAGANRWLAEVTRGLVQHDRRFVVVGGDHSCAIGTWSGVSAALRPFDPLGLIWIDAHTDMHTPETTHSGAINGMPIAVLLGHGAPELTRIAGGRSAIDPRHICLVGARSFEPEEVMFARKHGVRVIDMNEVARRGIGDAIAEARSIAGRAKAGFGVSLDLDAFDPVDAPGVGTPASGGIRAPEFLDLWLDLIASPACRGIEIVEYNPWRDRGERTARLLSTLMTAVVGEERKQWAG